MHRQISCIAYYTLLESVRNRLVWLLLAVALAAVGLTGFVNQLAITEGAQVQAALIGAFLRLCAVFIVLTLVVTSVLREFNDRGLELILGLPLPRFAYVLGKLLGYCAVALFPALLFGLLTVLYAPPGQAALWTASLLCELALVAGIGLLCALTFRQVVVALGAGMAMYIGARSMAALQAIGRSTAPEQGASQRVIDGVFDVAGAILPRLDEFTRSEWLVYHTGSLADLQPIALQSAVFLVLAAGVALFDFYRKNI